jgi:hypothetical protein
MVAHQLFIRPTAPGGPAVYYQTLTAALAQPIVVTLAEGQQRNVSGSLDVRRGQLVLVLDTPGTLLHVFPYLRAWLGRAGLLPDALTVDWSPLDA